MGMNVFYFLNQNFSFNLIGLTQIIIDAQHQQTPMQEKLQLYYSKQDAKMGHRSFGFDVMDQSLPRAANIIHQSFSWKINKLWHNLFKVPNNMKCKDSKKNSDVNQRTRHK